MDTASASTVKDTIDTPAGRLTLVASPRGLRGILWGDREPAVEFGASPHIDRAVEQLREYFDGTRRTFDLELDLIGTPFQLDVWAALAEVPFGEVRTYGEQAESIGRPRAVRAVGAANGKNPISIVLPCHRIIGADGTLTGYGGGLQTKRILLDLENGSPSLF